MYVSWQLQIFKIWNKSQKLTKPEINQTKKDKQNIVIFDKIKQKRKRKGDKRIRRSKNYAKEQSQNLKKKRAKIRKQLTRTTKQNMKRREIADDGKHRMRGKREGEKKVGIK